ncbi:YesL family protein [Flavonifractor hominis]|uniref:YesL family protein n=1 Tax=Flavonifractor hominis TaxID=3133178 RepID=A0ABV1ENS6_9FIRM
MFRSFFSPDNVLFRFLDKLVDLVMLSIFWLACCVPLVTIGPATAALYRTVVRCLRQNALNSWGVFFRTFRDNLRVGTLATLPVLAVALLLAFLHGLLYQIAAVSLTGQILYYAYCVFLLLPIGMACYLFPVLSQFAFQVSSLLVTCAKLAIAHLPFTLMLAIITVISVWLCSVFFPLLILLPTITALLHSFILERIFAPYLQQSEDTDPD